MTVKTFAGVLLKAGRAHRRKQRAKKALSTNLQLWLNWPARYSFTRFRQRT